MNQLSRRLGMSRVMRNNPAARAQAEALLKRIQSRELARRARGQQPAGRSGGRGG